MYKKHIFICTASPEKPGKCGHRGGEKLWSDLKQIAKDQNWGPDVRVNKSGCLNRCEQGIACVVYPQGDWHVELPSSGASALSALLKP